MLHRSVIVTGPVAQPGRVPDFYLKEEIRLSRVRIPTGPHQTCCFIRAQTYNNGRQENLAGTTKEQEKQLLPPQDPMTKFMYALKARESKRQYPRRFKIKSLESCCE